MALKRMKDAPAALELHIEELVLHGLPAGDRAGIGEALQAELSRLLAAHGLPEAAGASCARLDGGSFQIARDARGDTVGRKLARAVYRQLSPATRGQKKAVRSKP